MRSGRQVQMIEALSWELAWTQGIEGEKKDICLQLTLVKAIASGWYVVELTKTKLFGFELYVLAGIEIFHESISPFVTEKHIDKWDNICFWIKIQQRQQKG